MDDEISPILLTTEEKRELLRVGRFGELTTRMDWGDLCRQIKAKRGGLYLDDWGAAVIAGLLFTANGHKLKGGVDVMTEKIEGYLESVRPHTYIYDQLVYVHGLVSEQGNTLNNRGARVCELKHRAKDGRVGVQMLTSPDVRVWVKPDNLLFIESCEMLKEAPELNNLPELERSDMGMYLWASEGSKPVPGMKASMVPINPKRPVSQSEQGAASSSSGPQ